MAAQAAARIPDRVIAVHTFEYRGKRFEVRFGEDDAVALCLDGVVRKQRLLSGTEPVYLWTNVELQWEEHHFIEVRFWRGTGRLSITANGATLHDDVLSALGNSIC